VPDASPLVIARNRVAAATQRNDPAALALARANLAAAHAAEGIRRARAVAPLRPEQRDALVALLDAAVSR